MNKKMYRLQINDIFMMAILRSHLWQSSYWSFPIGIHSSPTSSLHPCLPQPIQRQRDGCPARWSWQSWWRTGIRWCWGLRWPWTWCLGRCVSRWSSHQGICFRRWTFRRCRCGLWSRLLGTWSWGWLGGMRSLCSQSPSRRCRGRGSSHRSWGSHRYEAEG